MSQLNCIYCGKKLPMVKKLTSEEFCSVAHRKAYHDEQEQLALARLVEDQQRRKPARKAAIAKEKPAAVAAPAQTADFLWENVAPRRGTSAVWSPENRLDWMPASTMPGPVGQLGAVKSGLVELDLTPSVPAASGQSTVEEAMARLSEVQSLYPPSPSQEIGAVTLAAVEPVLEAPVPVEVRPEAPEAPEMLLEALEAVALAPALPESGLKPSQQVPLEVLEAAAGAAQLPFDLAMCTRPVASPKAALPSEAGPVAVEPTGWQPQMGLHALLLAVSEPVALDLDEIAVEARLAEPVVAPEAGLGSFVLPQGGMTAVAAALGLEPAAPVADAAEWTPSEPEVVAGLASIGELSPEVHQQVPAPPPAELWARMPGLARGVARVFARPKPAGPRNPQLEPSGELAPAVREPLQLRRSTAAEVIPSRTQGKCEPFEELKLHPGTFLKAVEGRWGAGESLFAFLEPFAPKARIASVRRSSLTVLAKTFRTSRLTGISVHPDPGMKPPVARDWQRPEKLPLTRPRLKLQVLPARMANSALSVLSPIGTGSVSMSWQSLKSRWHDAPNDLRWIAIAVPVVMGLLWFAESPSAQVGAKGRISSMIPDVSGMLRTSFSGDSLEGLKLNIQRRAAVELADDFRQGLGEWSGIGEWAKGWTYDPLGFIRPRQLALFTPSLTLEDYRFEFLGAIERKALSWAFRAADVKNYYAARLEVTRGGPIPTVELVRWAVINGKAGPRRSIPLPMQVRPDTIYRVRVDVRGNDYVTTVQGQVVDVFTDDRLPRGGIGFFSESGEDARLRWVEVSHQYDMLGRLCAYLVPYNVSNSNVRSAP